MKISRRLAAGLFAVAVLVGSGVAAWSERPTPGDRWWIRHADQLLFRGERSMGPVVEIETNEQGHDVVVYSPSRRECDVLPPLLHLPDECRKCRGPRTEPVAPAPTTTRRPGCRCGLPYWTHFRMDV
jgi:hypothetical protein